MLFSSCNYTKHLAQNEHALTKNSVKVEGVKGAQYDDLIDLVRPISVKKFMGIFPIKVSLWTYHQPKYDSITGITKDSKFNQWCRKNGLPPVLIDTPNLQHSMKQIELAMFKKGYFDAVARADVMYLKKQKAKVNYFVTPNQPYHIRDIDYQIDILEYKRIVIMDTAHSLVKKGKIYHEDDLVAERARLVSLIKDEGYFYATPEMITFMVDTNNAFGFLNSYQYPTVSLTIRISYDDVNAPSLILKSKNRYRFNNALIFTNYDLSFDNSVNLDTIPYLDFRSKSDSTLYEFVTQKKLIKRTHKTKLIKDYKSRTIAGAIWMKRGNLFSQTALERTTKKLRDLRNFSIVNVIYAEDEVLWDSINSIGVLNTEIRLTRAQQNELEAKFDIRTDRTNLGLSYTNKNIFRGAEYLTISAQGGVYYYKWLNSIIKKIQDTDLIYGEVGGTLSFEFPRLLMLPKYQNINFWGYATEIKFSGSYMQYLKRLNLHLSYVYKWRPTRYLSHSLSPVELSTLHTRNDFNNSTYDDLGMYKNKFDKFFLPSSKYTLSYSMPVKNGRHFLRADFSFETAGLLLFAINAAINTDKIWTIFNDFKYGAYEKLDLNLIYKKSINKKNSFASRFIFGVAVPLRKDAVIPFERSFFVGGSNSMRGWSFRQLGPGGFFSKKDTMPIERVGDLKLELNLEYRGSIYKAIRFAVFSDIGNVWLLTKNDSMPNAEFRFGTFYKQIAVCAGTGLHLDFNFFLIRLDYGLPIYDPSKPAGNYWINKSWRTNKWWIWTQGIQFGINYAF